MRHEHIVPLSTQAVAILRDAHQISGNGRFVVDALEHVTVNRAGERRPATNPVAVSSSLRRSSHQAHARSASGASTND